MTVFDDHETSVRQRADLRRLDRFVTRQRLIASVRRIPLTEPREVIAGEDQSPRDGFAVFKCWFFSPEGHEAADVWARNADEATEYLRRFKDCKFPEVETDGSYSCPQCGREYNAITDAKAGLSIPATCICGEIAP